MTLKRGISILLLALTMAGCKKLPTTPTNPEPSPSASTTPTPSPLTQLRVEDLSSLSGATICCDDPATPIDEGISWGWPYVNEQMLLIYEKNNVNATEVRVGPFEGVPLDNTLPDLIRVLDSALSKRIYVFVGLIDSWALANHVNLFGDGCDVARRTSLPPRYVDWITRVVDATKSYPNVVYFDGNESFRCRPSVEWTNEIYEVARNAGATQLIGSNSGNNPLDFPIVHGFKVVPYGTALLESNNRDYTPEEWMELRRSSDGAVFFWKGPMSDSEWFRLLALSKER